MFLKASFAAGMTHASTAKLNADATTAPSNIILMMFMAGRAETPKAIPIEIPIGIANGRAWGTTVIAASHLCIDHCSNGGRVSSAEITAIQPTDHANVLDIA